MDVHRVGGRRTFLLAAPRYFRSRLRWAAFDVMVEDLNKVPLFSPYWTGVPLVLLVHHLFGRTAFREAGPVMAAGTWALERPLARVYRDIPVQAISGSTADDLVRRGFRRERIVIIPNGVDLDFYRPDAASPRFPHPTLLYLGRLKRYKRIDLVLRAVSRLRSRDIPVRLVVAGTGDAEASLRKLATRLGIDDAVEFRGFVDEDEKRQLFRRAWIHVLTSEKEGWGITNLEAAACGTPTVASDSPGLRDSVRDGRTGLLVRHGDIEALADAVARLVKDAALRQWLGEQARVFAVDFSWERTADRTEAHLRQVATTPGTRSRAGGRGALPGRGA